MDENPLGTGNSSHPESQHQNDTDSSYIESDE